MIDPVQGPAWSSRAAIRRRPLAVFVSLLIHAGVVAALMAAHFEPPKPVEIDPIEISLVEPFRPPPEPAKPITPKEPSPADPPPQRNIFRPTPLPPPPEVEVMAAGDAPDPRAGVEVSEADLAGAATAGSGGSGGACNMLRLLQIALRKDPMVQTAVAEAHRGKAIMVWNGDWVQHPGQEGEGLAAVREAILWEVGFAPKECRSERVRGKVLISLNDGPGSARLVVGSGDWRWSDLLYSRSVPAGTFRSME